MIQTVPLSTWQSIASSSTCGEASWLPCLSSGSIAGLPQNTSAIWAQDGRSSVANYWLFNFRDTLPLVLLILMFSPLRGCQHQNCIMLETSTRHTTTEYRQSGLGLKLLNTFRHLYPHTSIWPLWGWRKWHV